MCVYLNISCDMLEYTHVPTQPHKRRQNSNLKENFHPRIENSSKKWEMRFLKPKIKFFSEIELPLLGYFFSIMKAKVSIRGRS